MKRKLLVLACALILTACSPKKDSEEVTQDPIESVDETATSKLEAEEGTTKSVDETTTSKSEDETTASKLEVEEGTTEIIQVEEDDEEEPTLDRRFAKVDQFYKEFVENNTSKDKSELSSQVEKLTKKYGLFSDSKNTGLGVMYYKVATSSVEAKLISNDDLKKGTYFVYIIGDFRKGSPSVVLVDNRSGTSKETTPNSEKELETEIVEGLTNETAQTDVDG